MKLSKVEILFLCCSGVAFYLLNVLTPIMHDDIAYLFKYGPVADVRPTDKAVTTIFDVFESQYYHYLDVNGRAPLHFLIQFFLLLGKGFFNVINGFVFPGIILILYKMTSFSVLKDTEKFTMLTFVTCFIWFSSPFIGQTMLWLTGACNYLFGSFFVFYFLFFLQKSSKKTSLSFVNLVFYFIASVFAGWTQESITIGVSTALFFYFMFHREEINRKTVVMVLGFWIGTFLIIISPGTFNRIHNEIGVNELGLIEQLVSKLLGLITVIKIISVNLITLSVLCIANYFKGVKLIPFFQKQSLYLLSIFFCLSLVITIGMPEERILFGVNIILIVINTALFVLLIQGVSNIILNSIAGIFIISLVLSFTKAYKDCTNYDVAFTAVTTEIRHANNGIIAMPPIEDSRFVYNTMAGIKDFNGFHNRVMSFYLHVPSITILPIAVYNSFFPVDNVRTVANQDDSWSTPIFWNENFDYLVVDVSKHIVDNKFKPLAQFQYKILGNDNLKSYQLFIRRILGTIAVKNEIRKVYSLKFNQKYYLLIEKKGVDMDVLEKIKIQDEFHPQKTVLEINKM